VKEAKANGQHKSIIGALRAAALKWERSEQLLRSGNLSKLALWWVIADWLLNATSTPSSKSLMYKKDMGTFFSAIM